MILDKDELISIAHRQKALKTTRNVVFSNYFTIEELTSAGFTWQDICDALNRLLSKTYKNDNEKYDLKADSVRKAYLTITKKFDDGTLDRSTYYKNFLAKQTSFQESQSVDKDGQTVEIEAAKKAVTPQKPVIQKPRIEEQSTPNLYPKNTIKRVKPAFSIGDEEEEERKQRQKATGKYEENTETSSETSKTETTSKTSEEGGRPKISKSLM